MSVSVNGADLSLQDWQNLFPCVMCIQMHIKETHIEMSQGNLVNLMFCPLCSNAVTSTVRKKKNDAELYYCSTLGWFGKVKATYLQFKRRTIERYCYSGKVDMCMCRCV